MVLTRRGNGGSSDHGCWSRSPLKQEIGKSSLPESHLDLVFKNTSFLTSNHLSHGWFPAKMKILDQCFVCQTPDPKMTFRKQKQSRMWFLRLFLKKHQIYKELLGLLLPWLLVLGLLVGFYPLLLPPLFSQLFAFTFNLCLIFGGYILQYLLFPQSTIT